MRTGAALSRGGHVGDGGIQGWSAGDVFPWVIYTVEHYVPERLFRAGRFCDTGMPADGTVTLEDRFSWAEIRMKHPKGDDVFLGQYFKEDSKAKRMEAHRIAQARAEVYATRAESVWGCLDAMAKILHYGQPELSRKEVVAQVAQIAQEAVSNEVAKRVGPLYQHAEGY